MAQVNKQSIMLGSGRAVGSVWVDGGMVRGEGGPVRPQLVVPLTIEMGAMPEEATLVVSSLSAWLSTEETALPGQVICEQISKSLVPGFHARSIPQRSHEQRVDLRFFVTPAEVEGQPCLAQPRRPATRRQLPAKSTPRPSHPIRAGHRLASIHDNACPSDSPGRRHTVSNPHAEPGMCRIYRRHVQQAPPQASPGLPSRANSCG